MRGVAVLLLLISPAIASAQRTHYFGENGSPVKDKAESYFYTKTILNKKECLHLQFYSSDDSRKKEMECKKIRKGTFTPQGFEKNYVPGGKPWYTILWRKGKGPAYIQYWILGEPQLLNGTGIVAVEMEDGNYDVTDYRDSVFVRQFVIDVVTKDSIYSRADTAPEINDGFLQAVEAKFASLDKGGETGTATIDFVIGKKGDVTNISIRNGGVGPVTNKLIETEFASIDKWIPATFEGKPVNHIVEGFNIFF